MYAVQLAKNAGAHVAVTASDNKMPDGVSKADFCKALVGGCSKFNPVYPP
jgi:NADPH:quinone reductase-like Zn-dependent oxidoreductase